ncbi:MAG: hypothetical protein AAB815_00835 [Patescibacteria group bacterium]
MNEPIDLLQAKIDKAREQLPEETRQAIEAVAWKEVILGMRARRGYTFEQLGDLEIETELLLCGLLSPTDYPKELQTRMKIPRDQADSLVKDMNDLIFKKIREELIKIAENKKTNARDPETSPMASAPISRVAPLQISKDDTQTLKSAGIEIAPGVPTADLTLPELQNGNREEMLKKIERPELIDAHPISAQKLAGSFQIPSAKTDHSVENLSKTAPGPSGGIERKKISVDPYRELPE